MRISSRQVYQIGQDALSQQGERIMTWQRRISTGVRIERASQDAAAAAQSVALGVRKARIDYLHANQQTLRARLGAVDTHLNAVRAAYDDLTELTIAARDGALGAAGIRAYGLRAAQTVGQIEAMVAKTDELGRKLIPDSVDRLEVEPGVFLSDGIARQTAFGENDEGLDAARALRDALDSGRAPSAEEMQAIIDSANRVSDAQARSGLLAARVDVADQVETANGLTLQQEKSALLDTDLVEGATNISQAQALLEAVRSMYSKIDAVGLFRMIR